MIYFPDSMPTDAILLCINKIRGKEDVNNRTFANALWNVVGYAAAQALPEDKTIFEGREIGLEDFASLLDQALEQSKFHANEVTLGIVPWALILKTALKILISAFL